MRRASRVIGAFAALALAGAMAVSMPAYADEAREKPSSNEPVAEQSTPFETAVEAAKKAMAGAPQTALENALKAESLAAGATAPDALATTLWLQGEALTRLNRADEAGPLIERAIALLDDRSTKLAGDLLLARGRIARTMSEEGKALADFQDAYMIFEALGENRSQAIALQTIGTLYDSARQYDRVIEYYERASTAFSDGAILDLVSLNNRANAYRELKRYDDARTLLTQALVMAKASGSALLQARILTNLAVLDVRRGDFDAAAAAIKEGFEFVQSEDAKDWTPFLFGARAELEFARGRLGESRSAIEKAFDGADLGATPAPFRDFHEAAYRIFEQTGEPAQALAHLAAFKRIDDQGRDVAASANLALMNAEFEVANKELQIQTLRADKLESEAALLNASKRQERVVAIGLLVIGLVVFGFLVYAYRSARKTAKTLHDFNQEQEAKNVELSETNIALEEANMAKLEFLAVTSHEIRTPLNAIIGLSDVVLNGGAIVARDREYLEMVNSAGKHLLAIVNDILDVSKLEAGRLIIDKAPLDVGGCVLNVAEIWRKAAEDKGLEFDVNIEIGSDAYNSDGRLVRQVVSNLLSNAVKFTSDGRIVLRLLSRDGEGFIIEVADTGIGVAPEMHARIFEPFRQADGSLQRKYGGTGLGLAIVRKIAIALGGDVTLRSEIGVGSTFTVVVPAEKAAAVESRDAVAEASAELAGERQDVVDLSALRVLIAEDNPANAMVIRAYLQRQVAHIEIVENGALALEAVQAGEFDIVLMDKQMPVMDGVAATKAIRALKGRASKIPIIAVTADAFDGAREHVLENGMDGFVSKPLDAATLIEVIADTLATHLRQPIDQTAA